MTDIRTCVAAFFRSKGKNVMTAEEFLMGLSMNMRWMPYKDAERLLDAAVGSGILERDGEYVRPIFDLNGVDVPVGYRPPADLLSSAPVPEEKKMDEDVLPKLIAKAASMDIDRKDFMSYCRTIQKKMNVDIEVAAVMVLRDNGANVDELLDQVREVVSGR